MCVGTFPPGPASSSTRSGTRPGRVRALEEGERLGVEAALQRREGRAVLAGERSRALDRAGDASLTVLDLGALQSVDTLSIRDNAALRSVEVGGLEHMDDLQVVNNPLLPTADLAGIRTFESELSGNSSSAAP